MADRTSTASPAAGGGGSSAATYTPATTSNIVSAGDPIVVQVVPLRRPEMFSYPLPQCSEPGDLLHDVLAPPAAAAAATHATHMKKSTPGTRFSASAASTSVAMYPDLEDAVVLPALTYPPKDGAAVRFLRGEMYRATLVLHNNTNLEVRAVSATASMVDPRSSKRVIAEVRDKILAPHGTLERRVDACDLQASGTHQVSVLVQYADPTRAGEIRSMQKAVSLHVRVGLTAELHQCVELPAWFSPLPLLGEGAVDGSHMAPPPSTSGGGALSAIEDSQNASFFGGGAAPLVVGGGGGGEAPPSAVLAAASPLAGAATFQAMLRATYRCTVQLVNSTSSPLHLTEVLFRRAARTHDDIQVTDANDVATMASRDGLWYPGETRRFSYTVMVTPTASSSMLSGTGTGPAGAAGVEGGQQGSGSASAATSGGTTTGASRTSASLPLGTINWGWRRPNGDGGHDGSNAMYYRPGTFPRLSSAPPPTASAAAAAAQVAGTTVSGKGPSQQQQQQQQATSTAARKRPPLIVRAHRTPTPHLTVGRSVTLQFSVLNLTDIATELAVAIHADKWLPRFIYAGPTRKPLGLLAPRGVASFSVDVVPLLEGTHAVDATCLSIVGGGVEEPVWWPHEQLDLNNGSSERSEVVLLETAVLLPDHTTG